MKYFINSIGEIVVWTAVVDHVATVGLWCLDQGRLNMWPGEKEQVNH